MSENTIDSVNGGNKPEPTAAKPEPPDFVGYIKKATVPPNCLNATRHSPHQHNLREICACSFSEPE
jgi:hypothetical protein